MNGEKIKSLEEMGVIADTLKKQGRKIVQCHGVFDIVHYGHIKYFMNAKNQGDVLIVTVTPDRYVRKGPGRPLFNEEIRVQMLSAVECIDYVVLNAWDTAVETIKIIKPDVYVKGKEVLANAGVDVVLDGNMKIPGLAAEEEAVKALGGRLHLADEVTFSSSQIINEMSSLLPPEVKLYLKELKNEHTSEDVLSCIDAISKLKILIIGDTILDEYIYCEPLEKSGKEQLVGYKFSSSEIHAGGILAIAKHTAGFSNNITLLTSYGTDYHDFIKKQINKNIDLISFTQANPTLVKRRYINEPRKNKVFEVYNVDRFKIDREVEKKIVDYLLGHLHEFDLVLVGDFGHGVITKEIQNIIEQRARFLAVNTQLNSGNLGYNFITKYRRADFVSLNERELRLPMQEHDSMIEVPINRLSGSLRVPKINITVGRKGSVYFQNDYFYKSPALAGEVIDIIGAGDAVFAILSMLAAVHAPPKIVPFIGNCVGAIAVKIMGNKDFVNPIELKKFVSYILK